MNPKKQYYENTAATIIKNLEKRQMKGYYCPDAASVLQKIKELIPDGASIGWGGSMTLVEMGILEALSQPDTPYKIYDRDSAKTPEEQKAIYREIFGCDYFLMGTNAITLAGELVNIDGRANRVSMLCYGPEHVIIVAGMNKVTSDVESAVKRVRDIAAPPNAVRLSRNTPCAVTGKCHDCFSPDCICSQLVITRRSTYPDRIHIILVGEEWGY